MCLLCSTCYILNSMYRKALYVGVVKGEIVHRTGWSDESGSIRNANEWASFDDGLSTIFSENRASSSNNFSPSEEDRGYNVRQILCGIVYRILHDKARFLSLERQSPDATIMSHKDYFFREKND